MNRLLKKQFQTGFTAQKVKVEERRGLMPMQGQLAEQGELRFRKAKNGRIR